jgi:translation initiation factor 2B subunit (eIF-2B alpha/beta/delta family)
LVAGLADTAITITLYSDAAVGVAAARADVALVGADSVLADGTLVNKVGTYPLALACRAAGVPLYAVTELSKVYDGPAADVAMEVRPGDELAGDWELATSGRVEVRNQFFEPTPPGLLTGYVTELGLVPPEAMAATAAGHRLEESTP